MYSGGKTKGSRGGERLPIGVLKMDVEGFELKVIPGGRRFLAEAKIPFIVMETGASETTTSRSS